MRAVALLGLLVLPFVAVSCGGSSDAKAQIAALQAKDLAVTATTTKTTEYTEEIIQPGTTYAIRNIELEPRVDGYIDSVDFADGSLVKTGDLLFQIDPRPYEASLLQARGNLEASIAMRNLAAHNVERNRPLVETGAVSREQFDTYVATLEQYEGEVETAAGQLVNAELNLGYTMIRAPFDGRVGQRQVEVGDLVQAMSSSQMVTLVQYHPMRVLVSVPAKDLEQLVALQEKAPIKASVQVNGTRGGGGKSFDGEVDFINNQVNQMTSTVTVRVRFKNPDAWAYPGQYAVASLKVATVPNAIVIPEKAIRLEQGGTKFVWIINEKSKISRQDVETSASRDGQVWVKKGLRAGQRIVVDGSSTLASGDQVSIQAATSKAQLDKMKDETKGGKAASEANSSGTQSSDAGSSSDAGKGTSTSSSTTNSSSAPSSKSTSSNSGSKN